MPAPAPTPYRSQILTLLLGDAITGGKLSPLVIEVRDDSADAVGRDGGPVEDELIGKAKLSWSQVWPPRKRTVEIPLDGDGSFGNGAGYISITTMLPTVPEQPPALPALPPSTTVVEGAAAEDGLEVARVAVVAGGAGDSSTDEHIHHDDDEEDDEEGDESGKVRRGTATSHAPVTSSPTTTTAHPHTPHHTPFVTAAPPVAAVPQASSDPNSLMATVAETFLSLTDGGSTDQSGKVSLKYEPDKGPLSYSMTIPKTKVGWVRGRRSGLGEGSGLGAG